MKKSIITLAIVLLAVAAQAQTAIKVHNTGQISLQSATTSKGIQISAVGAMSIEPKITVAYGLCSQTQTHNVLSKAWNVRPTGEQLMPVPNTFYVLGNGNVYTYGGYYTLSLPDNHHRSNYPIEGAIEKITLMKGYYLDSDEFLGITPDEIENCENINPEAIENLLHDLEKGRTAGFMPKEMEEVLPEAVRHDPDGMAGINYNVIVTVLVEAFKEQQARIERLESILMENGLLK